MPGAEDKPEKQDRSDSHDAGVADLEEALRQIGNDILQEDVPERLRRLLRPKDGSDDASATDGSRDHPSRCGGTQRRDGEPSA